MEANLRKISSAMTVVESQEEIRAALNGELFISGKPVLVCRGADTGKTVEFIYRAFSEHKSNGEPYRLSREHKGLVHRDQFGCIAKVTAYEFEKMVERFFCCGDLLFDGNGTLLKLCKDHPALVVTGKCPRFSAQLWQQRRFLKESTLALFQWND